MSPAIELALTLLLVELLNDSCVMDRMLFGMIGILDLPDLANVGAYDDVSSVDQFTTGDDRDVCLLDWTMNPLIASQYSAPPCLRRIFVSRGSRMVMEVPRWNTYSQVSL